MPFISVTDAHEADKELSININQIVALESTGENTLITTTARRTDGLSRTWTVAHSVGTVLNRIDDAIERENSD